MGRILWQIVTGNECGTLAASSPLRWTAEDGTVNATIEAQLASFEPVLNNLKDLNVEICYFKNSQEAIEHSKKIEVI